VEHFLLIFFLTLALFPLARGCKSKQLVTSQKREKTMKTNHFQRSSVIGGALSSVVEHFLHTEGVAGSNPAARTILPRENGLPAGYPKKSQAANHFGHFSSHHF
jgi:hypothetical protein